jgi:putative heme transporter
MAAPGTASAQPKWWRRPGWRRAFQVARYVAGLGLAALAFFVVFGRRDELAGATSYLSHLSWPWLVLAVAVEGASLAAFGGLQRCLLRAGGVPVRLGAMTAVALAGNSINNSLPGGPVFASLFAFRQFRRRGADDTLAAWVLVGTTVLAAAALAILASVGIGLAESQGSALGIVEPTLLSLAVALVAVVLLRRPRLLARPARAGLRAVQALVHRPRGDAAPLVARLADRIQAVTPGGRRLTEGLAWGLGNWVLDCACLAASFGVVGAPVPWRALLLAYGAGQLAANLPITPGGLGVVEGSLTIALVAFGGQEGVTVAAVLVYRIISFWVSLPVGWISWAGLTAQARAIDRRSRDAANQSGGAEQPFPAAAP